MKLLPVTLAALVVLFGGKLLDVALLDSERSSTAPVPPAKANASTPPKPSPAPTPAKQSPVSEPTAEERAERAILLSLRQRRTELESREQTLAQREAILQAAELRLEQRAKELAATQERLAQTSRGLADREEQGWRQMTKLYESMKPREAAMILDELELPVLLGLMQRMSERKAAPLLAAMKPERARVLTVELARSRQRLAE